jgi:hypothetical protein
MKGYKLIITPEAIQEIQKAIDYYNIRSKGLGKRFYLDLQAQFIPIKKFLLLGLSATMMFVSPSWIVFHTPLTLPSTNPPVPSASRLFYPTTRTVRHTGNFTACRSGRNPILNIFNNIIKFPFEFIFRYC